MLWSETSVTYVILKCEHFSLKYRQTSFIYTCAFLKWNAISCLFDVYFYITLIWKKVQLELIDCLQKLMVTLLHPKQYVEISFDYSKVVIVMFLINNDQVNRKSSKMNNCKLYWKKILLKQSKNCFNNSKSINQSFHNVYEL